jgi:hypothetical protein
VSKRTANLIVISSQAKVSPAVPRAPQLACVNRKISEMTSSSNAHVYTIFAEAAFLAGESHRGSNGAATNARHVCGGLC